MTAIASTQSLSMIQQQASPAQATALVSADGSASSQSSFGTILDAINPLQHIPIVSSLYRAASGTSISSVSQIAGDTLYGGLIGGAISSFVSSVADVAVKGVTGKDISEHVIDTVGLGASSTASSTASAAATPTALVATASDPSAAATAVTNPLLANQVDDAVHQILRNQNHPERVAAQYQRAQTLDIGNKLLIKAV